MRLDALACIVAVNLSTPRPSYIEDGAGFCFVRTIRMPI